MDILFGFSFCEGDGLRRGKVRLCHSVNLLGPWTRPGFSGHLALGVGAPHPEAAAGEQSGVAGIPEVVRPHSSAVTWRFGQECALGHCWVSELRCGKPCEPTVFSYSLMDIHCVCLCTRCGFESCKMMTLLCCALVSLALPKLILVVRESSRSVPSFRYTGKCSTKFFHFQLFFFFYLPMKNPKYKISYLSWGGHLIVLKNPY